MHRHRSLWRGHDGDSASEGASGELPPNLTNDESTGGIDLTGPGALGKLDLPEELPDDRPSAGGCKKADFLFVIDNSARWPASRPT